MSVNNEQLKQIFILPSKDGTAVNGMGPIVAVPRNGIGNTYSLFAFHISGTAPVYTLYGSPDGTLLQKLSTTTVTSSVTSGPNTNVVLTFTLSSPYLAVSGASADGTTVGATVSIA